LNAVHFYLLCRKLAAICWKFETFGQATGNSSGKPAISKKIFLDLQSSFTLGPVINWMGDCLWTDQPCWFI